jgi:ribonuclease HI
MASATPDDVPPYREITCYFDGSCLLTPGAPPGTLHPGGYAAILTNDLKGSRRTLKDPLPDTTNNRAELTAAIKALDRIRPGAFVTMVGDSQYVIKGMTLWRFGWKRNGWRGSDKKPVKNRDLWEQLIELAEKPAKLEWVWTKGHAGNPLNEEADRLAKAEAEKLKAQLARQKAN